MLAACSPTVAMRGNLVEDRRLAQVEVGRSTAAEVMETLGTPSTVATFDPTTWYYIGQRTEQTAFFQPEVVERRVVVVRFDDNGVLQEMQELGVEDARDIELVDRQTPTLGREMGFLEQMVGNLGRFRGSETRATVGR